MRAVLIAAGCVALGLGILGIPLPVLPTTPFLLLAAWCFARSSERLHRWLLTNRLFGKYIRDYTEHRGIPRRVKVYTLVLLWATISLSAFGAVDAWWIRLLLFAVAIGVSVHIFRIKTLG